MCQSKEESSTEETEVIKAAQSFTLNTDEARKRMEYFAATPHPFGSDRQQELALWIFNEAAPAEGEGFLQEFTSDTPNPVLLKDAFAPADSVIKKNGRNVLMFSNISKQEKCLVLVGSHYDSKKIDGFDYLGANDSGSSSILLLHLLKYFKTLNFQSNILCDIAMVWFDGEEAVLPQWDDGLKKHPARIQDNTYGSRAFVSALQPCDFLGSKAKCFDKNGKLVPVVSLILLDMIGSENITISQDSFSSTSQNELLNLAFRKILGLGKLSSFKQAIEDDHIPFIKNGISAIDIIDFTHLDYWHLQGDEAAKISYSSIEFIGKIAVFMALNNSISPKEFFIYPDK
ncbi:MAG: M28 family peptidase [Bdellovibrionota bacterium]